ncbi:hypothetical protein LSAT2_004295 [Lamellibrachia satsuma]|nr:hypothetical protein LSAT2_004295 [Lamellibrachia satsuma]
MNFDHFITLVFVMSFLSSQTELRAEQNPLKMTYSMTTSSPNIDVDFTTLATEFRNASYQNENTTDVGNATSLGRGMPSPDFYLITTLAIIGIAGVLLNVAALAVFFKKENRKFATNSYLINLAISESTLTQ